MKRYDRQRTRQYHTGSKTWRAIRAQVLSEQPLCPICQAQGRTVAAVEVDHRDNDSHNNERSNLWGLCSAHHADKTFTEARGGTFRMKGCDAQGVPIDPAHHWHR